MSEDEPVDKNNLTSVIEWIARRQAKALFSQRIEAIEKEIHDLKNELQNLKESRKQPTASSIGEFQERKLRGQ